MPPVAVTTLDEEQLVQRFRETGDNACFEQLYRQARRSIFGVCLHFVRDPHQAEDLCHDVFITAYQRFSTLQGERFLPWVRRIARNLCLNRIRHERVRERIDPAVAPTGHAPPADAVAITREQLELASSVIRSLPEEQRRVFLLFHTRELSYREISESTGFTLEQVRSYLQNSRRNFHLRYRRLLEGGAHG